MKIGLHHVLITLFYTSNASCSITRELVALFETLQHDREGLEEKLCTSIEISFTAGFA